MSRFEWDERKNEINHRKHKLHFETAVLAFDDPHCVLFVERVEAGEERWHAIGAVSETLIATVAHTYQIEGADEIIRIISARFANRREIGEPALPESGEPPLLMLTMVPKIVKKLYAETL